MKHPEGMDLIAELALLGFAEYDEERPYVVARAFDTLAAQVRPERAAFLRQKAHEIRKEARRIARVRREQVREEAYRNAHPRTAEELLARAEQFGFTPSMVDAERAIWRAIPEEQRRAAMFEGKVRREMGRIRANRRSWSQWASVAQVVERTSPSSEPKGPNAGFRSCLRRYMQEEGAARQEAQRRLKEEPK